jgi:hypothetical protein
MPVVEELAAPESIQHRVVAVLHNIVSANRRKGNSLPAEDATLQLNNVFLHKEIITFRNFTSAKSTLHLMSEL